MSRERRQKRDERNGVAVAQVEPQELKQIALTDDFKRIMRKYGVKLRPDPITVTHKTYGKQTVCSPSVYAVYETAINAVYTANFIWQVSQGDIMGSIGCMNYHEDLIVDGRLCHVPSKTERDPEKYGGEATNDYHVCCQLLIDADLYFDLLD